MDYWELIIVGAGPAGLAAGIYAARSGLKTLIVEEKMAGGTTADAPIIENYPGFSKISGGELAEKMVLQCRQLGVTIHELESAIEFKRSGNANIFLIMLSSGTLLSFLRYFVSKSFRSTLASLAFLRILLMRACAY